MNTRDAILAYLQDHPYSCADELSQVLLQTRANIQYHLKRLEKQGQIMPIRFLAPGERGRPKSYYALPSRERPENLAQLAGVLLHLLLHAEFTSQPFSTHIDAIASRILDLKFKASLTHRLNRLARELSARGYQARWEAHGGGPQVVFRNCPYAVLLPDFPELCLVDTRLLALNLDASVTQIERIRLPDTPACRFSIKTQGA